MDNKTKIIELFYKNVKDRSYNTIKKHCGSEGHWLEKQFEISHNSKNEADIFGYELKKESKKITFGDFSASYYIFSKNNSLIDKNNIITRTKFIEYFGEYNGDKKRYSWSGKVIPKYNIYNDYGQMLFIDNNNNILIKYSYEKDKRDRKINFPDFLKTDLIITIWYFEKINRHINNKFNDKGFIICKKNNLGIYNKLCFGKPFDFYFFIEGIKNGSIYFDSGMYQGNSRNYSQFRSSLGFWNSLIIEEYP